MPVSLEGTVELPVGKENDVSIELGEPVPLGFPVEFPVGKENIVSAELGEPVPLGLPVEFPAGKEKDVAPELYGTSGPEGGAVPLPVGNEKVVSEPDGTFDSPDCVGCGMVQAVELPTEDEIPPVPGAVPVPVCLEDTPVSEPEPGSIFVELPVGAPEMPVSDCVTDEAPPGLPGADSMGMPVDSRYMESAGVGSCGGLVWLVQFSAVLFPVGKLNDVPSPLPGSASVPDGLGGSPVDIPLAVGKLKDVASLAPGSVLVPDWLGSPVDCPLAVGKLKEVASLVPGPVFVPEGLGWSPVECPLAVGKLNEVPLPAPGSVLDPDAFGWPPVGCPLDMGKLKDVASPVPGFVLEPD